MQQNGRPHSTPTKSTLAPFSPYKVEALTVTLNPFSWDGRQLKVEHHIEIGVMYGFS